MADIIVFGVGQIAEILHYYLENDSCDKVTAFTVDKDYIKENTFKNLPVVPFEEIEKIYPPDKYKMLLPISYKNVNKVREEKYKVAKSKGYSLINYISSKAVHFNTAFGDNTIIMENNVIQPYVHIGNNVILWSGNHIGHHTRIEDNCFLASHVVVSGSVVVGENCFLGVNATVRDNIFVGKESVIGAGALILKDVEEKSVYSNGNSNKLSMNSDQLRSI